MKYKIHHIAISVVDMQDSHNFYKTLFGFTDLHHYIDDTCEIRILQLDHMKLELYHRKRNTSSALTKSKTDWQTIGVKHFAFVVEDIVACRQQLEQEGVAIVSSTKEGRNPLMYFYIKDPNGILIEIVQETAPKGD